MLRADRLEIGEAFVLLIDVQEKLFPSITDRERLLAASLKLLGGARLYALPVIVTEQYPEGIGATIPEIRNALDGSGSSRFEKLTFSCCTTEAIIEAVRGLDRTQVVVCGIEAHVCVQQTVLDLRAVGMDVFVCADATGSRGRYDRDMAFDRMRQAGAAITTVESVLFELCFQCGTPRFKGLLDIIKSSPPPRD